MEKKNGKSGAPFHGDATGKKGGIVKDQKPADQAKPDQAKTKDQKMQVTKRDVLTAEVAYKLETAQIEQAIADGWIRWAGGSFEEAGTRTTAITNVKIGDKTQKGEKGSKKYSSIQPYEKLEAISDEGEVLLSGGKRENAVLRSKEKEDKRTEAEKQKGSRDHFNYGMDLEMKRIIRRDVEDDIAGPERAILSMAKIMFKKGKAKSLDAAIAKVRILMADDEDEDEGAE